MVIWYTLGAVAVVSLLSLVGVVSLFASGEKIKKISFLLVSLAAGTLIGDAFIHLLPEAAETNNEWVWPLVIAGIALFFILEKVIHWRHCHMETSENHPHPVGMMNLLGDGLHNFFDGLLIAGSFIVSPALGIATTIAVIIHEIPQEIADFGVLIHAGYSKAKAIAFNFLSALSAVLGAVIVLAFGDKAVTVGEFLVPVTAGAFIYIAVADLFPELHKESRAWWSLGQLALLALGVGIMYILKILFE
jgi:zinc and cadmium transporter